MANIPKGPLGLILNPASGRGRGGRLEERIMALATQNWPHEVRLYRTERPGHGTELAARAIAEGAALLAGAGGDGTFCEVIQSSAPARIPSLPIPIGTGNDLVRTLGISSLDHSLSLLRTGRVAWADVGELEGRLFANILSCGFDGEVAELINTKFRWLRGTPAYVAAVLYALASFRPVLLRLTTEHEVIEKRVMLCAVANAKTYGGGMKVAPDACLTDGLLDIILLGEVSPFEFLRQFPKVFSGAHLSHPAISVHRAKRVILEAERALPLGIDGDVIKRQKVEVRALPSHVPLIVP